MPRVAENLGANLNFKEFERSEFNKTIIPFAPVGHVFVSSQTRATRLVGYLLSHKQRALLE